MKIVNLADNVLDLGSTYVGGSPTVDYDKNGVYITFKCGCVGRGSFFYFIWAKIIRLHPVTEGT